MFAVISENLGTIITGLVVFGIAAAIIARMIRDVKKGKRIGCDCGCEDCSSERKR